MCLFLLLKSNSNPSELRNVNENHQSSIDESTYDKRKCNDQGRFSGTKSNLSSLQSLISTYASVSGEANESLRKKSKSNKQFKHSSVEQDGNFRLILPVTNRPEHTCYREGLIHRLHQSPLLTLLLIGMPWIR